MSKHMATKALSLSLSLSDSHSLSFSREAVGKVMILVDKMCFGEQVRSRQLGNKPGDTTGMTLGTFRG